MKKRKKQKKIIFWEIAALLAVLAAAFFIGMNAEPKPQQPDPTTQLGDLPPLHPNPFTAEDFAYEDGYLTCLTADAALGIDVSVWQDTIDWQQVKEAGVEFAMLRIGYRGSDQGGLNEDSFLRANYAGAKAAGIKVGGYFFSQAVSVREAQEEAEYVLNIIKDWKLDMPVVYDWEYIDSGARTAHVDARTLTDCTKAFCEAIKKAGFKPMVYFNRDQAAERMILPELTEYPFWLALYDPAMDYPYRVDMWQYTSQGTVPGIEGDVDLNLYFYYE